MSDPPSTRRLLGWQSVSLVLLFLKAVAKYSQTIAAALTGLLWRNVHASRSARPHTHRSPPHLLSQGHTASINAPIHSRLFGAPAQARPRRVYRKGTLIHTTGPPSLFRGIQEPLHTQVMRTCLLSVAALIQTGRLWHQLTLKLSEFFDHPLSKPCRVVVFQQFVRDFESKLNQQKLVELGTRVSKEIASAFQSLQCLPFEFIPSRRSTSTAWISERTALTHRC